MGGVDATAARASGTPGTRPLRSPRVRRAWFRLGYVPADASADGPARRWANEGALEVGAALAPGEVALVTGRSGSGKSTLLESLRAQLQARGERVVVAHPPGVSGDAGSVALVDGVGASLDEALALLARAGLGEARPLGTPIGALSDGERFRLGVARAMDSSERAAGGGGGPGGARGVWVLIDECCSMLDRLTGAGVARSLRRWASRAGVRLVCAAPGDGLAPALRPDVRVRMRPDRGPELCRVSAEGDPLDGIRIEVGTRADYDALARFHYRAGPPATFARVWRAIDVGTDALIGVLVVSRPTLNGAWRDLAWPGRYSSGSKRQRAARLNAELRTISRVIVEPRWRGCGAGRALVRSYLDEPLTPATEAVAAMGAACPFFARAGMVEHPRSVREPDARLLDALDHAGLEPWRLIDPLARAAAIRDPFLMRELRRWANSSGATRRYLHQSPDALTRAAARAIGARPRAYTHTRGM